MVEAEPTANGQRRGRGKSDEIDAELIARSVLGLKTAALRNPRQDTGIPAALRVLVDARDRISLERTRAINPLTALVRTVDLGIDARRAVNKKQYALIAAWRHRQEDLASATARREALRLAKGVRSCDMELSANRDEITSLVASSQGAVLLQASGIGTISAAVIITAWSHPGRVRPEASFAALAGVTPVPASSGNTTRHRINRGGDRRLNQALSSITLTRISHHEPTREYVARGKSEGRTTKEIRRYLTRYVARQVYRTRNTQHPLDKT